jgi:hypothetical protein
MEKFDLSKNAFSAFDAPMGPKLASSLDDYPGSPDAKSQLEMRRRWLAWI